MRDKSILIFAPPWPTQHGLHGNNINLDDVIDIFRPLRFPFWPASAIYVGGANKDKNCTEVSLLIQFECGKMTTRITPNMNTFYAEMVKNEKLRAINIYNTWQTLGY